MNKDIEPDSKHIVAWVFGSNEENRAEVLSCSWDPQNDPEGTCKSHFVANSIENLRDSWPWASQAESEILWVD